MPRATLEAYELADLLAATKELDATKIKDLLQSLQSSFNLTDDPERFNEVYAEDNAVVIDPMNGGKRRIVIIEEEDV
jgi:hypothetical protein